MVVHAASWLRNDRGRRHVVHATVSGQKRNVRKPVEAKKKRIARRQRDMLIEKVAGRYFDKSLKNRYI
jgi:hypothetical protein